LVILDAVGEGNKLYSLSTNSPLTAEMHPDLEYTMDLQAPAESAVMMEGTAAGPVTIALLLPTLNELEGLKASIPHIDRTLVDQIIVIDGGSTDGTIEYALEAGLSVASQMRPGLHFAIYDIVLALDCDYVIEFSPDGNCQVEQLADLVALLRTGYDMVVVSRYLEHAVSQDDHAISAFGNWLFSRLMRPLARFGITDALNIYRGYRRDILLDPDFRFYLVGPVLEPLVTGICALRNRKVVEIPGDEPLRIGGVTKRSVLYNGSLVLLMIVRLYLRKFLGLRV
jgi:glycosyltransferase involved in cell wall biosynthesis